MATKKYRVDTDKGSFVVEVEEPDEQQAKNAQLIAANNRPLKEPTTKTGGWLKSLSDTAGEIGRAGLESMAHPGLRAQGGDSIEGRVEPASKMDTLGDLAGLALANTPRASRFIPQDSPSLKEPVGNRVVRGVARRTADVADLTPNIVNSKTEERVIGALRDFGKPRPGNMLDRYMPNKSSPVQAGIPQGELHQSNEAIVQSLLDQHMPNQPGEVQAGIEPGEMPQSGDAETQSMLDRFMPNQSGEVQAGVESELPQHPESLLDRHMPNQSSEVQPGVEQGEMPQSQDSITQSLLDRFMPNQHGEIQPGVMDSDVSDIAASTAEPQQLSLAEALRGQVGSKDAARSLGMKAKDIKEIAPQAEGLPTEVRARLDAAFDALPTAEAKIKYAESAPNNLAREYLLKKLAGAQ